MAPGSRMSRVSRGWRKGGSSRVRQLSIRSLPAMPPPDRSGRKVVLRPIGRVVGGSWDPHGKGSRRGSPIRGRRTSGSMPGRVMMGDPVSLPLPPIKVGSSMPRVDPPNRLPMPRPPRPGPGIGGVVGGIPLLVWRSKRGRIRLEERLLFLCGTGSLGLWGCRAWKLTYFQFSLGGFCPSRVYTGGEEAPGFVETKGTSLYRTQTRPKKRKSPRPSVSILVLDAESSPLQRGGSYIGQWGPHSKVCVG